MLTAVRPLLVIGHAAAAGEAPANTLAGVRAALDAGADAMEIDVQLCADAIPVLMHDLTVDRTTNRRGRVRDLSLSELRAADAGGGEHVPALGEVLDLVAGRLTVMCELKVERTDRDSPVDAALVESVLREIDARAAWDWTAIHSFDPDIVRLARETEPRVSAAIISPPVDAAGMDRLVAGALKRNAQAISVEHSCLSRERVFQAKRRQLTVWAWTADHEADWARLAESGADGIITNVPHRLRAFLDRPT
jgi:glycerophosphoryl diester phosphodiesterase